MINIFRDMKHCDTLLGSFLLGIGLVGMLDGIIFHQVLQWHSVFMHTDRFNQIVSDGLFHLAVTVIIVWGALVLWNSNPSDHKHRGTIFLGGLLFGAGIFNFFEVIIDHHLLQIHHVRPGSEQSFYDIAFDITGLLMIIAGIIIYNSISIKTKAY